ncbi:hypothetical protein [Flavobacterium crassostreae]|uniref:Uncharacterized protein n=1 Tax=Flavobacterium crassostreae TaxID=1763534 RepID=A0A1B9E0D0_9FLAO|nr:hypothetical protein [Flavobacterium crassostreae]OCB75406.1 hypothetical protein LPBF_08420 [Flavobacterium crassostreae]
MRYISILIILFLCISSKQIKKDELEFRILNKLINDNSNFDVELINRSTKDYYILLDTTSSYNKLAPISASEFLYLTNIGIKDDCNNEIDIELVDYECYNNLMHKDFKYKIKVKNILKIKSKQRVYFKIPFKMKTKINDNCWYGYQKEKMKKTAKYFCFLISPKLDEYLKQRLPIEIKDSLKQMGYELYDKEINSNKVPLILK